MTDSVADFFGAWAETSAPAQRAAIEATVASQFTYADPRSGGKITSLDALCDYVSQFAANAPGWAASVAASDRNEGYSRSLVAFGGKGPDGSDMVQHGTYFAELDEAGKITLLVGFVGTGAPA